MQLLQVIQMQYALLYFPDKDQPRHPDIQSNLDHLPSFAPIQKSTIDLHHQEISYTYSVVETEILVDSRALLLTVPNLSEE